MPANNRFKTSYPGVFYINGKSITTGKPEKIFHIRYRRCGKLIEEKAGRQFQDDMTPARANHIRTNRIEGNQLSNEQQREDKRKKKDSQKNKWLIDRLFAEYIAIRPDNKSKKTDIGRYNNYISPVFGKKEPNELAPLDVDRLRIRLQKKLSPQTVKHILNLLTWVINFGVDKNLCNGIPFKIKKPKVNNIKTEDLSNDQLKNLLIAIDDDHDIQTRNLMKLVLYTGMRRGELFKLKWKHVDFIRGFIMIKAPKGGTDQQIPLNNEARSILQNHPKSKSDFVFPGKNGQQRTDISRAVNRIKKKAGLPSDFRPLHGLRHVYASMLASSGKVDLYTLQRLLTHKDPRMTQRYAHLRDETLRKASALTEDIVSDILNKAESEEGVHKIAPNK
jgi:integrase